MNINRPVYKCNTNGDVIKEYASIKDAASENNINGSFINNCLRGREKRAGGFIWKYCNKYLSVGPELDDPFVEDFFDDDDVI